MKILSDRRVRLLGIAVLGGLVVGSMPYAAIAKGKRQPVKPEAAVAVAEDREAQAATQKPESQPTQDVPPVKDQSTPSSQLTQPTAMFTFVDVPDTRVGVDPNNVLNLTMFDAIARAVRQNNAIEISKFDVKTAEYNVFGARGVYDPTMSALVSFTSATFPVTNIFGGGGAGSSLTQKDLLYNAGWNQLFRSGATVNAFFNNDRTTTDATNETLNPQYSPRLGVEFSQPIMRNFNFDATRRNLELAKKNFDLSDAQFRQEVIDIISKTQNAYWDLKYALRNVQIQREAVQLARVQLENNLKQVEAGTLAPIELRSTESDLEARKESVILALQGVTTAENNLKNLMLAEPTDSLWSAKIIPVDPAVLIAPSVDLDTALHAAILNRPELDQMKLKTTLKEIDRKFYKNQLKPQVDAFFNYNIQGRAGNPALVTATGGGGIDPLTGAIITSLNQTRRQTGLDPFDPAPFVDSPNSAGSLVPDRFVGGYGRALGTLFSNDFRTYEVGVRFSFPIGNNVAEANYGRTQAELRQLDAEQRQLVQQIQVEVRNALQAVDAARQRFEAARASRVAAEAQLQGEEERFRAGLSTNFFVLDRQNQLSEARGREAQALTDYNKAIVDLQRVTGTTMSVNNVTVSSKE